MCNLFSNTCVIATYYENIVCVCVQLDLLFPKGPKRNQLILLDEQFPALDVIKIPH